MKVELDITVHAEVVLAYANAGRDGIEQMPVKLEAAPINDTELFEFGMLAAAGQGRGLPLMWRYTMRTVTSPSVIHVEGFGDVKLESPGSMASDVMFLSSSGELRQLEDLVIEAQRAHDADGMTLCAALVANHDAVVVKLLGSALYAPFGTKSCMFDGNGKVVARGDSEEMAKYRAQAVGAAKFAMDVVRDDLARPAATGFKPRIVH